MGHKNEGKWEACFFPPFGLNLAFVTDEVLEQESVTFWYMHVGRVGTIAEALVCCPTS